MNWRWLHPSNFSNDKMYIHIYFSNLLLEQDLVYKFIRTCWLPTWFFKHRSNSIARFSDRVSPFRVEAGVGHAAIRNDALKSADECWSAKIVIGYLELHNLLSFQFYWCWKSDTTSVNISSSFRVVQFPMSA